MSEPTPEMVREAALWHATLGSGEATEADRRDCAAWQAAHPGHAEAFRRLQAVLDRFQGLPARPARQALHQAEQRGRQLRRSLAAGGAALLLLLAGLGAGDWDGLAADHSAGRGEIAHLALPDGSRATLDGGSAIDLRYDAAARGIRLRRGEVLLEVRKDAARPLTVHTPQGSAQALGTRFSVRRAAAETWVTVAESRVRACDTAGRCLVLRPGQAARLGADGIAGPFAAPPHALAWAEGRLVVEDRPLAEILDQLRRHRRGVLRYDAAALAGLSVSGVLPLHDTDQALAALAALLPIRLRQPAPFWTVVERR
ncbi:FecR domain-containing protein [Pseudoroseomonas cervicalis]